MFKKPIVLAVAGMATAILISAPVFAAKTLLSDDAIATISGNSNNLTVSGNSTETVSLAGNGNANIQFNWYQWSDNHTNDQSQNKGGNNVSGSASQVQQNVSGHANALVVGSVSQNVLISNGGSGGDNQNIIAYAVVVDGGF